MNKIHGQALAAALDDFGRCDVTVSGASMWPFVKTGDTVRIVRGLPRPAAGMVVAFLAGDQLVVHRVVRCRACRSGGWDLWIHGDSSPRSHARVDSGSVLGHVVSLRRKERWSSWQFRAPWRLLTIPAGYLLQIAVGLKAGLRRRQPPGVR